MTNPVDPSLEEAQRALAESEERHRSLFQNAVEGIVTMGEDRCIQSMNPAAQRLFGYAEEEVIGENVKILMPSPYHEEHDGYVKGYVRTGRKKIIGIGREVVGRRKDGTTFPLELSVAELQLTSGRVFTGILRDITDRKRAEDELQRINEHLEDLVRERTRALEEAQATLVRNERLATLGQLAGSVAHEVRNPLGVVRNAVYYLQHTTKAQDEDTLASFEEIERGLARADRIIGELLDYARDPKTNHEEFALAQVIDSAMEGLTVPPCVEIDVTVPVPIHHHYGDPGQIRQILNNLVGNAIQAMPDGGRINICYSVDGDNAVIEVHDTGCGMTEGQLAKVFEPLFTTKARGIGLGLALSRRYAELNNATITAESRVGEGSSFRLTLPILSSEDVESA